MSTDRDSMYRRHDPALGGAPDRTITDHDRGVTGSMTDAN